MYACCTALASQPGPGVAILLFAMTKHLYFTLFSTISNKKARGIIEVSYGQGVSYIPFTVLCPDIYTSASLFHMNSAVYFRQNPARNSFLPLNELIEKEDSTSIASPGLLTRIAMAGSLFFISCLRQIKPDLIQDCNQIPVQHNSIIIKYCHDGRWQTKQVSPQPFLSTADCRPP